MSDFGTELYKTETIDGIFCSVFEFKGKKKIQLSRVSNDGTPLKLGRLTILEAEKLRELMDNAIDFLLKSESNNAI